jgi:hypothetical protein
MSEAVNAHNSSHIRNLDSPVFLNRAHENVAERQCGLYSSFEGGTLSLGAIGASLGGLRFEYLRRLL